MSYQLVFDYSQHGFRDWWFPACGLAVVAAGLILVAYRRVAGSKERRVGYLLLGFGLLWTGLVFHSTFGEYLKVQRAVDRGEVRVVEGVVTDFVPMPAGGHANEQFSVDGHRFCYSDYVPTVGFNNASSHGGPIREGLHVRIGFVDSIIVRLEVAR